MDNTNIIIQGKEQIIIDISVKIEDVIHNEHYIKLYYPTDERLRNERDLILIHPSYCQYFSGLLKGLKETFMIMDKMHPEEIPDKDNIENRVLTLLREDKN